MPPRDISGSAIPLVGAKPVTTQTLISACSPTVRTMPKPSSCEKFERSGVSTEEAAALGAAAAPAPAPAAAPVLAKPPASPERITPRAVAVTIATPQAISRRYKAITTTEPVKPNSSATIE